MYSLDDYNTIMVDGFEYILDENIKTIIQNLNNEMDVLSNDASVNQNSTYTAGQTRGTPIKSKRPFYQSSSSSSSNIRRLKPNGGSGKTITDEDWENARPVFKVTTIEKKEGIEKYINDIRICLNKITNKNYQTHCDTIIELLKNITSDTDLTTNPNENVDALTIVSNALFDIASNNKFYSEIYADLNVELSKHFPIFSEMISGFIDKYNETLETIKIVDATENYDLHCACNKLNDKRKAMSTFIVNLMKKSMISNDTVCNLMISMLTSVFEYIEEPKRINEVEEITENIFIMVTLSISHCKTNEKWEEIVEKINLISGLKTKDKQSLSSRALFKYKDIVDFLHKNRG
uniref:MIF4G domain-containing protein n=1 Tax=viral metagenome TaxID=1070528 RepID=A0A6C0DRT0_9ZZZZ